MLHGGRLATRHQAALRYPCRLTTAVARRLTTHEPARSPFVPSSVPRNSVKWGMGVLDRLGVSVHDESSSFEAMFGAHRSNSLYAHNVRAQRILDMDLSSLEAVDEQIRVDRMSSSPDDIVVMLLKSLREVAYFPLSEKMHVDLVMYSLFVIAEFLTADIDIILSPDVGFNVFMPVGSSQGTVGISAVTNLAIRRRSTLSIVVKSDEPGEGGDTDLPAQLFASMAGAYFTNMINCDTDEQDMFGVSLVGTLPTIFKVHFTRQKFNALRRALVCARDASAPLLEMRRYDLGTEQNALPTFASDDKDHLRHVFQCLFALRQSIGT
ncbi:Uncharacterized protein PBTT_00663 [Plasmodiophora brassicae]